MPLYDYSCLDCGGTCEVLHAASKLHPPCPSCGSMNLKKMMSAHSSLSGVSTNTFPGQGDTSCCGTTPMSAGCSGPGSCCGKPPI